MMKVDIRPIRKSDNPSVQRIIQNVMPEFGAGGSGFAIHDEEVLNMYDAYQGERSIYYVCAVNGQVVGGGGIAPLKDGEPNVCELKKMYFLPQSRGKGYGKFILERCLNKAKEFGYAMCYLETFNTMTNAIALYEKHGFRKIQSAMGNTGHFACDTFYVIDLTSLPG